MNNTMKRTIVCAALVAVVTQNAKASIVEVPTTLRTTAAEQLAFAVPARGVQIYECRARTDGAGSEWAFVAPEAELFDTSDRVVGRHGAGPVWEAHDGRRVVGSVKARLDAPVQGAIPWLLLSVKYAGPTGLFRGVTSIQRVNTVGGLAPSTGCDDGTRGTTVRVPYTADYLFYRAG